MPNKCKTPFDRIKEFGSEFLIERKGSLYCKLCNLALDHSRKSSIDQHFSTKAHVKNVEKRKLRENLTQDTLEKDYMSVKRGFAQELVKSFTEANIPLYKLEHSSIKNLFEKYLPENIQYPSTTLVRKQLPCLYENYANEIKQELSGKKVAILCDESTDCYQRYFLQILCKDLNSFLRREPVLLDTVYLEETNFKTVSQAVVKTLNKYEIQFENVYSYVTDNASYMYKSYNSVLVNLLPNSRHSTCVAHIIALVADTWRIFLKKLDKLVGLIKFIFCKSPARRIRYKVFLQDMFAEKPLLPPEPVITRWNTWFAAIKYHVEYWSYLITFISDEIRLYSESESLSEALELLRDDSVKSDVSFLL